MESWLISEEEEYKNLYREIALFLESRGIDIETGMSKDKSRNADHDEVLLWVLHGEMFEQKDISQTTVHKARKIMEA
ncbi:MAG: hypothetical protein COU07_03915 [Candidatus Harrisonbacteria bacterium CG10_big_fil_rev_8_21_14_0_10_40_38]|uniref:Uncharacterized protein n=1 Tax=Candidatus Harrisonbacteria bacterium CG10_big_fil_rev_8_21_14_0_10_40_38 TaxID=1974583 RepID=A0A2H0URG1_9BACT|nr:MAG: hypothetical protein COU07_03915 [Candidatus Harrisonbacteria bacterium CG10_big_fil_rev_8_21_14_0_10_40_38]